MIFQRFRTKLIKAAGSGLREAVAARKSQLRSIAAPPSCTRRLTRGDLGENAVASHDVEHERLDDLGGSGSSKRAASSLFDETADRQVDEVGHAKACGDIVILEIVWRDEGRLAAARREVGVGELERSQTFSEPRFTSRPKRDSGKLTNIALPRLAPRADIDPSASSSARMSTKSPAA